MWHPGFPYLERQQATLSGYHRAFCIYSRFYRGTPDHPGLVLGLDRGGTCQGVAFRIARADWPGVVDYLNERELIGYAYQAAVLPIEINDGPAAAYTFVADHDHTDYAGDLSLEKTAKIILTASGVTGLNRDYLFDFLTELANHGVDDREHHTLRRRIEYLSGAMDQYSES